MVTSQCQVCGKEIIRWGFKAGTHCSITCKSVTQSKPSGPVDFKDCKTCGVTKPAQDFHVDSSRRDGLMYCCKSCNNARSNESRHSNLTEFREYRRGYEKNKRAIGLGIAGKLRKATAGRIRSVLNGTKKSGSTIDLLGCSIGHFMRYLENKFPPGMSWDNYGRTGWHVDHKIPCALFNLNDFEQQRTCFHFTNLQPLNWLENLSKGSRV